MRHLPVVLVALALAGCGGSAGVSGSAASLVPDDAVGFAALDTHVGDAQWQAVDTLLARFPVQDPVLGTLHALGGEVDLAAIGPDLVVLTKQDAKLAGFRSRKLRGWTAFSRSSSALAALGTGGALADAATFEAANATLPRHAVATVYARGANVERLLGTLPGQDVIASSPTRVRRGLRPGAPVSQLIVPEHYDWAAAGVVADGKGTRIAAQAHVRPPTQRELTSGSLAQVPTQPFASRLVDEVPADAIAVADFAVAPQFEFADPATLSAPVRDLMTKATSLTTQLDAILGGETAVYIEKTAPLEATIVTQPSDTKAALATVAVVAPFLPFRIHTAVIGGELVVSTSRHAIATFTGPGAKLSSAPGFVAATKAAGAPSATTGFVYGSGTAVSLLGRLLGVPLPAGPQQRPLFLYADRVGQTASSVLFLQTG